MFDTGFQLVQVHNPGLLGGVVLLVVLSFGITYLTTYYQSRRDHSCGLKGGNVEPPQAPYAVPWLANTLSFAWDTESYIWRMQKFFGKVPFRMQVAGQKFVFIPGGDVLTAMFKSSRDMNNKVVLLTALRDQFGMPERDLDIWRHDNSGIGSKPAPGFESWAPERRAYFVQHRDLHTWLMGPALDVMTANFVDNYTHQLAGLTDFNTREWTSVPSLYHFLRTEMFSAALRALCGQHIFEVCPNFNQEFWEFDNALTYLLRRVPRWASPKSHAARDQALASIKRWHKSAREHFDWTNKDSINAEWEPVYGARLMRARQEMFTGTGHTEDGSASLDLGMLWAANANIIPASMWSLLNILRSPNVLSRVLEEVESSLIPGTDGFDISLLCSKPLLNSIYLEALRYSVAVAVARNPDTTSVNLTNWKITPDATAMSICWFAAHDQAFWNDGRNGQHPVNSFWPERFLKYPDDPASGPIKTPTSARHPSEAKPRSVQDDKLATVVTTGTQAHLFPYGGGVKMCPGRFFAKQEMLAAIAVLLHEFEVEITDSNAADSAKPDPKYFPLGAMPPDRNVPVRMRRRQKA
ncbi:cytochrome P450 [Xylariales sp. PMI_506]|nr:cytochrome P450 [Xylariales sp. PMI_506]